MKMPNRNLSKVTSKPADYRDYLSEPYLDADAATFPHGVVVATNGSILAACPVELDDGDTSGHVSNEAIKAAIKASPARKKTDKTANIRANGSLELDSGATYPRENIGTFPDYKRVIPDKSKAEMVISLDAKLLKELADAICTPGSSIVTLHIKDNRDAFYVDSDKASDCYGVIMPCRI